MIDSKEIFVDTLRHKHKKRFRSKQIHPLQGVVAKDGEGDGCEGDGPSRRHRPEEREGAGGVLQQRYGKEDGERVELGEQEPLYSSTACQLYQQASLTMFDYLSTIYFIFDI